MCIQLLLDKKRHGLIDERNDLVSCECFVFHPQKYVVSYSDIY